MNEFQIRVNGRRFDLWESAEVQRSIDNPTGVFSFASTSVSPAQYPVKAGDKCQVMLNDTPVLTGFVDGISAGGSVLQGQNVSVVGRDNTSDIIDSSMRDSVKNITGPISLVKLCEEVITSLGAFVQVVDVSAPPPQVSALTDFDANTDFTSDSGRNCMEFLIDFARKKQVYLVPDGSGRLLLFRPGNRRSPTALLNEKDGMMNNVISWKMEYSHQDRYNLYRVRSEDNFGSNDDADYAGDGVDRSGDAIDPEIRRSRYCEKQAPESSDDTEVVETAIELANVTKALASTYECTVAGIAQPNGTIWDFGQLVSVSDDFAGLKGTFLVKAVRFEIDTKRGSTTHLTVVPPEAYRVRLTTAGDERTAIRSPSLQKFKPSDSPLFIR